MINPENEHGEQHLNDPMQTLAVDIAFIRTFFGNERDVTHRLNWHHAVEVMMELTEALFESGEVEEILSLQRAALGHDLLEDTPATAEELRGRWGDDATNWITGMTKKMHDYDKQAPYIDQLTQFGEEVWLVKLSDIVSNASNSYYWKDDLDPHWRDSFWLPLLRDYRDWYRNLEWKKYPQTGAILIAKCDEWIAKLVD